MHPNSDVQLWNWFLTVNSDSINQQWMKFAFIVTGSIILQSYWVSDNVKWMTHFLLIWVNWVIESFAHVFLQLSRESWWYNSQGRREFQIFSLMLAARFGYKHDQWQNTDPLFWRAFLIRINKHHRTQTTKPQALTIHNIALKLLYFKLPNATLLKSRFPKYRRAI